MPWLSRLGSASDTRSPTSLRARSNRLAGYSPERLGHVPSINFCNCVDSRARPRAVQTPPRNTVASHRTVGGIALARRHQPSWYSLGVARPTKEACDNRRGVRCAALGYPNLSYLGHPLSLTSTCRRLDRTTTGDQTGSSPPVGVKLGLSQHRGRILDAVAGELARRARNAETSRALKGRFMPMLAKATTINRTRGAFHPWDRRPLFERRR